MKPTFLFLIFFSALLYEISAQNPQFAVVKPNGTTILYSSWVSAYAGAVNDDYLYLPGTTINGPITINKRIHLFGAGFYPDSTTATGKTNISGTLLITSGANGGSIEGIRITQNVSLGGSSKLQNYSVKRCQLIGNLIFVTQNNDSIPEYCTISESILQNIQSTNSLYSAKNILFVKNIITSSIAVVNTNQCIFKNNIFTGTAVNSVINSVVTNTVFENNIFLSSVPMNLNGSSGNCYNSFINNLKIGNSIFGDLPSCPNQVEEGNISVTSIDSIFMSYSANSGFDYSNNYHLLPTCPGIDAGTDGTDLGIYGTNNPAPEGWVPSNPHIYFKQVDSETGSDGKLHIQVGVRANNN